MTVLYIKEVMKPIYNTHMKNNTFFDKENIYVYLFTAV